MASFDAIRSAAVGAIGYLCKPQPPLILAGCWPLTSSTDKADVSCYGNNYTGALNATTYNALAKVVPTTNQAFLFDLNLGQPFSVDFFLGVSNGAGRGSVTGISIGSLSIYLKSDSGGSVDNISYGGDILASGNAKLPYNGSHVAITYDGTTVRRFINGILNLSATVTMSGTASGFSIFENSVTCFGNLRVVQKCLGTTSYPVPSTFYTGYEVL